MKYFIFIIFISLSIGQDKGQTLYQDGKFDESRAHYEYILNNRKKDDAAKFGLAVSAYRQKDLETATQLLNDIMNTNDKSLQSKVLFNIGTLFSDQQKMEEGLNFFKKAIESDPTNIDARVNYEIIKRKIKKQQEEQENSEQNDNSNDQKNSNNSKDLQENKKKNHQNDTKNQDQSKSVHNEEKEKEKQNTKDDQLDQDDEKVNDQKQHSSGYNQEMENKSKTDKQLQAEAILNALKDQEKINQKRQISKTKSRKLEKDW